MAVFNTPEQPRDTPLRVPEEIYSAEAEYPSAQQWDPVTNYTSFSTLEMPPIAALPGTNHFHSGSSTGVGNDQAECSVTRSQLSGSGLDSSMVWNEMSSPQISGWGNVAGSDQLPDDLNFDEYLIPSNMLAQSDLHDLPQGEIDSHIYRSPMDTQSSEPSGARCMHLDTAGKQSSWKGKEREIDQPVPSPEVPKLMDDPDLKSIIYQTFSMIVKFEKRMDAFERRLDR